MKTISEISDVNVRMPPQESHNLTSVTNSSGGRRRATEAKTITAMIHLYCHHLHSASSTLCPDCTGLMDYALLRLDHCRFGEDKPTCAVCPVHCYQRARRDQIKAVMRYAGPRMLWRHPILSFQHWLASF